MTSSPVILFWFYKELDVCENRLQLLRKYNLDTKIFGLYGGSKAKELLFKKRLGKYLDSWYCSPFSSSNFKWHYGDLVLLDWFEKKGKKLNWDHVIVVQWDMLVFAPFEKLFPKLKKNDVFFSGLRRVDKEMLRKWDWVLPNTKEGKDYLYFRQNLMEWFGYLQTPLACLFILSVFPKAFFDFFSKIPDKKPGFLEYKLPTLAEIAGFSFVKKDFGVQWYQKRQMPLNAIPTEIPTTFIQKELKKKKGWRVFHPYYRTWN